MKFSKCIQMIKDLCFLNVDDKYGNINILCYINIYNMIFVVSFVFYKI